MCVVSFGVMMLGLRHGGDMVERTLGRGGSNLTSFVHCQLHADPLCPLGSIVAGYDHASGLFENHLGDDISCFRVGSSMTLESVAAQCTALSQCLGFTLFYQNGLLMASGTQHQK